MNIQTIPIQASIQASKQAYQASIQTIPIQASIQTIPIKHTMMFSGSIMKWINEPIVEDISLA